ncbi:MAG: colanic acid biosynthesis glycosyl transferase WcaI [Candidatus Omnitrophota bacterium]|jgi:colanic acid biosynthesis glycosyl transferase WcaI
MKILFLTDNFPPELNAPAGRTYEHACYWTQWGHDVTIITCAPNFPEGEVFDGYENKWRQVEYFGNIRVVRVKTYMRPNEGFFRRTLDYLSFMVMGFVMGLFEKRPDVIVGTSPQFFTAIAAWLLAVFKRRPFILEVRDLWPESIVATGSMRRGIAFHLLQSIELFLYARAKKVIVVTKSFFDNLTRRGIDSQKIGIVYGGVNQDLYYPITKEKSVVEGLGLANKFVIGYLGTFGLAHGLNSVIEAANKLREDDSVVFLLVGGGAEKKTLSEKVERLGLTNVKLLPFQRKRELPKIWSVCDIALVHLRDTELFKAVIPSKIFEAMAMGLPILAALPEGEASALIRDHGCGVTIPSEAPQKLAEAILQMKNSPDQMRILGEHSVRAAAEYSRESQARCFLIELEMIDQT